MTKETWRIDQIRQQLGRAIADTQTAKLNGVYKTVDEGEAICTPRYDPVGGYVRHDVGITWSVKGQSGRTWKMIVALDYSSDTYSAFLVRLVPTDAILKGDNRLSELLTEQHGLYNEDLEEAIVDMWKQAIEKHCNGFVQW